MESVKSKRRLETEGDQGKKRRSRFSDAPPSSLKLEDKVDMVAKLAALQASVKAQISSVSAPFNVRPVSQLKKARDFTLRLDEHGRQIDELGRVIETPIHAVATLKANVDAQRRSNNPYLAHLKPKTESDEAEIDYRLQAKVSRPKRSTFNFIKEGTFVKKAEQIREKELTREHRKLLRGHKIKSDQVEHSAVQAPTAMSLAVAAEKQKQGEVEAPPDIPPLRDSSRPIPVVEWWDEPFIPEDELLAVADAPTTSSSNSEDQLYNLAKLEICRTFGYVQHPRALRGVGWETDKGPASMPMYLTKAERKRVRRQSRAEKEREKRDKMALGLLPPPPPKMKLSNFMRVLGEQAVVDPSKVEQMVQKQVQARRMGHEMRNQARKLTPEERRTKRRAKLAADSSKELCAAVLRVTDLSNPKHRFKVDANAQQLGLTGCVIMCPGAGGIIGSGMNVVVAEGGQRAIRRFLKLMTKRIRWTNDDFEGADVASSSEDEREEDGHETYGLDNGVKKGNAESCQVIWQGVVMSRAFGAFRFQECKTADLARKTLLSKGVPQYWDMASKLVV